MTRGSLAPKCRPASGADWPAAVARPRKVWLFVQMARFRVLPLIIFSATCLAAAPAPAAETSASASVPAGLLAEDAAKRAVQMLSAPQEATRQKAIEGLRMRAISLEATAQVVSLLKEARAVHATRLATTIKTGAPALGRIRDAYTAWDTKRTEVMKLILTDYHKDPAKVAMLTREHQATAKLQKSLERTLGSADAAFKPFRTAVEPLIDLDRDVAKLKSPGTAFTAPKAETYFEESGVAGELLETLRHVRELQEAAAESAAVAKHNEKESKWASKSAVAFALRLNAERAVMGLDPLRLDERLSDAASGHSKEMADLHYFAHESPVAENKTPGDRARNARFEGNWSGENIFMGSTSPDSAYNGWWGSDGHRFIMFAKGPNTLGIGPVGTYWTMMTGSKAWKK